MVTPSAAGHLALPAEAVEALFPFHIAFAADWSIAQVGSTLARLCPKIGPGGRFVDLFTPVRPEGAFDFDALARSPKTLFFIRERSLGILLRGQMLWLEDRGLLVFICSPWLLGTDELTKLGLTFDDFAIHDPAIDLLHVLKSERMATADLRRLSDRLAARREELRASEERLTLALAAAELGLWDWDIANGRLLLDERSAGILGYGASELGDDPDTLFRLMHPEDRAREESQWVLHRRGVRNAYEGEFRARASDGRWVWIQSRGRVVARDAAGRALRAIGTHLDVTARRRAQTIAAVQHDVASALTESIPLAEMRHRILATLGQRLGWSFGAIWVPANDGLHLQCAELWHASVPSLVDFAAATTRTILRLNQGLPGRVWSTRKPAWFENLGNLDPKNFPRAPVWAAAGLRSAVCFPIMVGGLIRGVIELADFDSLAPDPDLLAAFETIGPEVGQVLARLESEREARKLALIAARTDNAVIVTDAQARVEWVNDGFTRLTGYTLDEMRGKSPGDVLQCDDTDRSTIAYMAAQLAEEQGFNCEILNRGKDGRRYWVRIEVQPVRDAGGRVVNFMAVESDITGLRAAKEQAEVAAREAQRLGHEMRTILELSPVGFVAFDQHGTQTYANPSFFAITGLSPQDLTNLDEGAFDALLAECCDETKRYVPMSARAQEGLDVLALKRPRRVWLARAIYDTHDAAGAPTGRFAYFRDVTRETEIDRMKSEFLSTAAHELRTPMASIHGFSELLLSREFDAQIRRDIIETIHRQSQLLVNMVNDLLDLARIEARGGIDLKLEKQPLVPLVRDAIGGFLVPPQRAPVRLRLPQRSPIAEVDDDKLQQALTNIVSNAYKYSPGGGDVVLDLVTRVDRGHPEVGVRIRDHGIGMSPEQLGRLFERFYRADPTGSIPGTGLGMSLVKEIADLMGGAVTVKSELGFGTEVTLWLREIPEAAVGTAGRAQKPSRAKRPRHRREPVANRK